MKTRKLLRGSTILEGAGALVLLSSILLGVVGSISYMRESLTLQYILDREIHDTDLRGIIIENGIYLVNEGKIEQFIRNKVSKISEEIRAKNPSIYVDGAYLIAEIDTDTGVIRNSTFRAVSQEGSAALPSHIMQETNLESELGHLLSDSSPNAAINTSLIAVPRVIQDPENRYLPFVILVGIRAGINLSEDFAGQLWSAIGGEPFTYDVALTTLRSEIE